MSGLKAILWGAILTFGATLLMWFLSFITVVPTQ